LKKAHAKASDLVKFSVFGLNKAMSRWRYVVFRVPLLEKCIVYLKNKKGEFLKEDRFKVLASVPPIKIHNKLPLKFKVGLVKDLNNYGDKIQKVAHWYKYERFLVSNSIDYEIFEIHKSNWMQEARQFNLVIFRPDISPWALHEARSKIYVMEKEFGIKCFPSYREIWNYEDKIRLNYLYNIHQIAHVPTFISHSKLDCLDYINNCTYPIVSKINTGSASKGVHLIENKKNAKKLVDKVFAEGLSTYWPGYNQKNYVYFQPLIDHEGYDLRIIVIGDKAFGYYKMVPKDDFKASGGMYIRKSALPKEAIEIAYRIKNNFNATFLAVDFLVEKKGGNFLVLETSIFVDIYSPAQTMVDGIPGYYLIQKAPFGIQFISGEIWLQELILEELLKSDIHE
jgi:glutathione synthase/RimK-type ligase-like ATP-grasp enzyme